MDRAANVGRLDRWLESYRDVPLPEWRLYSALGMTGRAHVARAVKLVDLARKADVERRPRRAQHLWTEAHRCLRANWGSGREWMEVAREVFWETHWAFVRGLLRGKEGHEVGADDRAFAHLAWIQGLADLLPSEAAATRQDQEAVLRMQLDALENGGRLDDALRAAQELRRSSPGNPEYVARAAKLVFGIASRDLEANGKDAARQARALREGGDHLAELRRSGPPQILVFELEATLRRAHAIRIANGQRWSDALAECRKALTLDPHLDGGEETWKQLVESMGLLQKQMEDVRERLRSGGSQLSPAGAILMREADQGFGPAEAFLGSEEHSRMVEQREAALALMLWREAGLPETAPDDPRPRELMGASAEILSDPPPEAGGLGDRWQRAAAGRPLLAEVDADSALVPLRRRLFPDETSDSAAPTAARLPDLGEGAWIAIADRPAGRDGEPFAAWLYGRRDLRIKLQCLLAVVAIAAAGLVEVRETLNRRSRAEAYAQARAAALAGDRQSVMDASAAFLRSRVVARDERETEVSQMYDEALVTWLVRDDPPEEQLAARVRTRRAWRTTGRIE
jgi:hypothetical protein